MTRERNELFLLSKTTTDVVNISRQSYIYQFHIYKLRSKLGVLKSEKYKSK